MPERIALPGGWYLGAHGDPIAVFNATSIELILCEAGTVRWEYSSPVEDTP